MLYGGVLAVSAIARASYIINFPEFCNISLAAELMIGVIFMMSVKRLMRIKSKGLAACFIFIGTLFCTKRPDAEICALCGGTCLRFCGGFSGRLLF